jgi:TonB family protein
MWASRCESPEAVHDSTALEATPRRLLRCYASPAPTYPDRAIQDSLCGRVLVCGALGEDGSIPSPQILRAEPPGVFDAAVLDAVSKWRFALATTNTADSLQATVDSTGVSASVSFVFIFAPTSRNPCPDPPPHFAGATAQSEVVLVVHADRFN